MKLRKKSFGMGVAYGRVIRGHAQNEHEGMEQKNMMEDCAHKGGGLLMKIFMDIGKSGVHFNRPKFQEMLKYIDLHYKDIRFLMVPDVSKLTIDKSKLRDFEKFLHKRNIKLISVAGLLAREAFKPQKTHL